jgi:aldehyde:ferredoxin oxidoreductase
MPAKYWRQGVWNKAENVSGQKMFKTILTKRATCYGCPIGCKRVVKISSGSFSMDEGPGPEYETCAAFGSLCLNDNLESIAKANDLCNRYGLDTISTGSAIGFVMDCYENGILGKEAVDGLDLGWGNSDSIVKLVHEIGNRRGLGYILGEGVLRASEKIGRGSGKIALHIKGMEVPFHDPRAQYFNGLEFTTSNRGACHLQAFSWMISGVNEDEDYVSDLDLEPLTRFQQDEKVVKAVFIFQNLTCVIGSLVMCLLSVNNRAITIPQIVDMYNSVTGQNMNLDDLLLIGERIFNIKRLYNNKLGATRKNDTLPTRIQKEPLKEGSAKGHLVDIPRLLDQYYVMRGWSRNGIPTQERLNLLGLK